MIFYCVKNAVFSYVRRNIEFKDDTEFEEAIIPLLLKSKVEISKKIHESIFKDHKAIKRIFFHNQVYNMYNSLPVFKHRTWRSKKGLSRALFMFVLTSFVEVLDDLIKTKKYKCSISNLHQKQSILAPMFSALLSDYINKSNKHICNIFFDHLEKELRKYKLSLNIDFEDCKKILIDDLDYNGRAHESSLKRSISKSIRHFNAANKQETFFFDIKTQDKNRIINDYKVELSKNAVKSPTESEELHTHNDKNHKVLIHQIDTREPEVIFNDGFSVMDSNFKKINNDLPACSGGPIITSNAQNKNVDSLKNDIISRALNTLAQNDELKLAEQPLSNSICDIYAGQTLVYHYCMKPHKHQEEAINGIFESRDSDKRSSQRWNSVIQDKIKPEQILYADIYEVTFPGGNYKKTGRVTRPFSETQIS
ncbi:MAG: hypothetical protein GY750_04230 [Lentisphaerae bacterium]|nr:hypothetical protein [Lentisphaerota bacterium]MCP4100619.1 hypothetical protein [Lentisphaerota bacterium]